MNSAAKLTRITLEQAQYILATEEDGSPLWAAANSIVSLYQSNEILQRILDDVDDAEDRTGYTVSWELNSSTPCHQWFATPELALERAVQLGGEVRISVGP